MDSQIKAICAGKVSGKVMPVISHLLTDELYWDSLEHSLSNHIQSFQASPMGFQL